MLKAINLSSLMVGQGAKPVMRVLIGLLPLCPLGRSACSDAKEGSTSGLGGNLGIAFEIVPAENGDVAEPSYLLGVIHLATKEQATVTDLYRRIYDRCETIVFEADTGGNHGDVKPDDHLRFPEDGKVSRSLFAPDSIEAIEDFSREYDLDFGLLMQAAPFEVVSQVSGAVLHRLGYNTDYGAENQIERWAERDAKSIFFLESIGEQIDAFGKMESDHYENRTLWYIRTDATKLHESLNESDRRFRRGDIEWFRTKLFAERNPKAYKVLVQDRNKRWIPRIDEILAKGHTAAFLVGISHLVGEGSLIDHLESRGYRVHRIASGSDHFYP